MRLGRRPAEPAAIRPSLPHLELAGPSAPRRGAGAAGPRASTAEAQERAADRSGLGADLRAAGRREADEPIQCPLRHGWLRAGPGLPGWARPGARGCRLTCSPAAGGGGVGGEAGLTRDGAGGAIAMVPAAPRAAVCPIRRKFPSEKGRGTCGIVPYPPEGNQPGLAPRCQQTVGQQSEFLRCLAGPPGSFAARSSWIGPVRLTGPVPPWRWPIFPSGALTSRIGRETSGCGRSSRSPGPAGPW